MFATAGEEVQLWSSSTLQPCLRFNVDKARTVSSVSWTADGRQLASISQLCEYVNITEFTSSKHRHVQMRVQGPCVCCQFSHQHGPTMCVGLLDGTVQLLKNGKTSYSYRPHKKMVTRISFNSNDSFVASGAYDGSVALLSLDIKSTMMLNEPTRKAVVGLQWSPHSSFKLVTTAMDGLLYIWDTSSRRLKSCHCLHPECGASSLTLSPVSEPLVITVGHDSRLVLFDMRMAREEAFVHTPETLESIAFLPDGQRVVGGATSGRVYLYDLRNFRRTPPAVLGTHTKPVTAIAAMHSVQAEEQMMASASAMAASEGALASSSSGRVQRDIDPPVWLLRGSDMQAAGDVEKNLTQTGNLSTNPRDAPKPALSPGEVMQEAAHSWILDKSWVSMRSSSRSPLYPPVRRSNIMPVRDDSLPGPETETQAAAALAASPHTNGASGSLPNGDPASRGAFLALSKSTPSTREETSLNIRMEGAAAMGMERLPNDPALAERLRRLEEMIAIHMQNMKDLLAEQKHHIDAQLRHIHIQVTLLGMERPPDDPALAERVRRLEDMMASQMQNMEHLLAEQKRHIDAHLRHIHIEGTLMGHSSMQDTQVMLQEVLTEMIVLRAEMAELRNCL